MNFSMNQKSVKLIIATLIVNVAIVATLKSYEYELWWERCLGNKVPISEFRKWIGESNAPSRIAFRKHVINKNYKSILDVPCGLCMDYFGFQKEDIKVDYYGLDITKKVIEQAKVLGVPNEIIRQGSINAIPYDDASFDICYARHILEHLNSYELAILELIRVARKEVFIVFYLKPQLMVDDLIDHSIAYGSELYQNTYSKQKLEKFIGSIKRVSSYEWQEINGNELILHIYLK